MSVKKKPEPETDAEFPEASNERSAEAPAGGEADEQVILKMLLREANIPPRYQDKRLDNFKASNKKLKEVVGFAGSWAETFQNKPGQKGLFIYGATGCGKSHIASAILKLVIAKGFSGYWFNMTDLMTLIRDFVSRNAARDELDYAEMKFADTDLIVLDDLGVETVRGLTLERLYNLINLRYELSRPLIVTSNLQLESLGRHFEDESRIVSRLSELCARFAPFPDVDYRLKDF